MPDIAEVIRCLRTTTIAAIPDYHNQAENRLFVQKLLTHELRPVRAFFFEWQQNVKFNTQLSKYPFGRDIKNQQQIEDEIAPFFTGAAKDAQPSLQTLVSTAAANNIITLASDGEYAPIVRDKLNGYDSHLFQPSGLAARDTAAAAFIKENITASRIGVGRLLLWGANHFTENFSYGDTLQQELNKKGIDIRIFDK